MNRLHNAASAYLASAALQPVHWQPWSEEAFAEARAAGKPLLLDIGAVWCHWCHVMDGESYEDAGVAAYLNEHFVCVKVDRDERPDVDLRYQRAVQALTGQGGWPLTAFLTPDGDVFYGGTYFPPDGRHGRPGFRTVLERVREIFHDKRDKVDETARELRRHVQGMLQEGASGEPSADLLTQGAEKMARLFDFRNGGFGTQPKFPHPSAVEFLLERWWSTGEPWLREIADKTLGAMARGGVYDQVGGGFHRYAVDAVWRVPHFEKMAYDNAELLRAYARGFAATGTPLYRETAEGIVRWAMEVLAHEDGGFGASQDADVGLHDDGDYFTWTDDEAHALLTVDEWDVAHRRWDIYADGEMHHDPRRNVLWVARSTSALAEERDLPEAEVIALLASSAAKLKAARDTRQAPFVDRSLYTGWNAMLADAFLEAAAALGREDTRAFALRTLERLWGALVPGEGLPHRVGEGRGPFLLEDQVHAAAAFLTAYEHSGEDRWLDRTRELMDLVETFHADAAGGYFDIREVPGAGFMGERAKPIQDAPTSSPNAVAALVLLRLHTVTDDARYLDRADRLLAAFAGAAADLGLHGATYLRALAWRLNGGCRVEVADPSGALARTALATWRPWRVITHRQTSPVPGTPAPVALVCAGTVCAAPATTAGELQETLVAFGRNG